MKKLIIIILILFTGCGPFKDIRDKVSTTKETELLEKSTDSLKIIDTNKEINEKVAVKVPESNTGDRDFDEAVNRAVTNILNAVNIQKQSGDNYLNMFYDERNKRMVLEAKIAETQNSEIAVTSDTKSEKTFDQNVNEYIKKIKIPIWIYIIGILFALIILKPILIPIIRMVSSPATIGSEIKNILK